MLTPILMAGGTGTRLWPLSRTRAPKQVHPLFDDETMLRKTADRLVRGFGAQRLWVATAADQATRVRRELPMVPASRMSVEPERKGTGAALALALVRILHEDPDAVVVYSNADNHVRDVGEYLRVLRVAEGVVRAEPDRVVLIGIRPSYPETGYGYIRMGDVKLRARRAKGKGEDEVFSVRAFVEKPDLPAAKRYAESWEYLWNPTLIVARAENLLAKYARHLPGAYARFARIAHALGTAKERTVVSREFRALVPISLEYDILEKERGMLVIPADFGWTDVGSWRAVHEILATAPTKTVSKGPHLSVDSSGNLLVSGTGKLIATVGVHDMVVVETGDAILVCPKSRAQDVKKLVETMIRKKLERYL